MNTLIYIAAAALCFGLAFRAWYRDPRDLVRRAFLLIGVFAAISYAAFAVYLVLGTPIPRYVHAISGAALPICILTFLERFTGETKVLFSPRIRRLSLIWVALSALFIIAHLTMGFDPRFAVPHKSLPELLMSLWVVGGFGTCIRHLWQMRRRSDHPVERARIRYLLVFLLMAASFFGVEQLGRWIHPMNAADGSLDPIELSYALQGLVPPVGTVWGTLFIYFLYQVVQLRRLVDLDEVFSRIVALAIMAVVFAGWAGISVLFVLAFLAEEQWQPAYLVFQIFLSAALFLSVHEPLKRRVSSLAGDAFNRAGRRLEATLDEIDRDITKAISLEALGNELLGPLEASGRSPFVSLYLWDQERGAFRLKLQRGASDQPVMLTIGSRPFTDGFHKGERIYEQRALRRLVLRRGPDEATDRSRIMEAMDADLTIVMRSGDLVLGWLNLKDERWSDGFSQEEIRRLVRTVDRAAIVVENIHSVEQMEEQHRLAALGTMAAGLAHEIRNPLAGIKGAAQYLQTAGDDPAEVRDFLDVIVGEADRLNGVVTQFLDYARPLDIRAEPVALGRLLDRLLDLIRAEGLPPGVELRLEVPVDLPRLSLDSDKVRQVLLNLVHNAIQAVGTRGLVTVRAAIGEMGGPSRRGGPAVEISVADDGQGIEAQDLDKLFIPFFTTKRDGTGLGLSISRRLVEAQGGEIAVRSQPGKGSLFTVRFPLPEGPG